MASDVYFFMSRADLHEVFYKWNESERLQFVPVKDYADPQQIIAYMLDELPDFGITRRESELQQDSLLVMLEGMTVGCMTFDRTNGTTCYYVGPAQNPDSLLLWPSGEWDDGCIIRGRLRMSEDTPQAKRMLSDLKRILKEKCVLVTKHYLGQQALQRHRAGTRLALSVRAAVEYDFRLPEQQTTGED